MELCKKNPEKFTDILRYIQDNNPHIFGIQETDLHSISSRTHRRLTYTTQDILDIFCILGYKLELPSSWQHYGQARVLVYVSDEIRAVRVNTANTDLPSITLDIGFGQTRKTRVCIYYREWTSGVTGDNSDAGQRERWGRQLHQWRMHLQGRRDLIMLGDGNICTLHCNDQQYPANKKVISDMYQDFLLSESCVQIVNVYTRSQTIAGGQVSRACLDHITTNNLAKCSDPVVTAIGDSDHHCVSVVKYTRELKQGPKKIRKRNYKNFDTAAFLTDINQTDFSRVTESNDPDIAASMFSSIFRSVLNRHAPIKVYNQRTNYLPFLLK